MISRIAWATATALLATAAALEIARHGAGGWQVAFFAIAPDLSLFLGAGSGLEHGQLHPRAVHAYNLLHRGWGPLVLALAAATGLLPLGWFAGALAWGAHITLDRTVGYGLRTRDGFQRR